MLWMQISPRAAHDGPFFVKVRAMSKPLLFYIGVPFLLAVFTGTLGGYSKTLGLGWALAYVAALSFAVVASGSLHSRCLPCVSPFGDACEICGS